MRKISLIILLFPLSVIFAQHKTAMPDQKFKVTTIKKYNDYEGAVVSTFIELIPQKKSQKAVLYIHGYNDYFFQEEMALKFDSLHYNFFAVDLRKYGRSHLKTQKAFNVRNLNEYFPDIDTALTLIQKKGYKEIILMGHSTGGLITSLYCNANTDNLKVDALILNSPFLDMNMGWFKKNIIIPILSLLGKYFPNIPVPQGTSTAYAESLLKSYQGEWDYDTTKKFIVSPDVTSGWIHAINTGQRKIRKGLAIQCPILVMHSDKSLNIDTWTAMAQNADIVLNVKDIQKYAVKLGPHVTDVTIANGMHDLILSKKTVREQAYNEIFKWLSGIKAKN